MGPLAGTLAAISMGAVYMGALTYLGNAPNLMIYAIAVERGIKMPSFFAYLVLGGVDPRADFHPADAAACSAGAVTMRFECHIPLTCLEFCRRRVELKTSADQTIPSW